jgi:hypothetical protein
LPRWVYLCPSVALFCMDTAQEASLKKADCKMPGTART